MESGTGDDQSSSRLIDDDIQSCQGTENVRISAIISKPVFCVVSRPLCLYKIVHHGHSPWVIELNSIQFAHRHDVALSGKSYGCVQIETEEKKRFPLGTF